MVQPTQRKSSLSLGFLLMVAALLFSFSTGAAAQSGIVAGVVRDAASGRPLENAKLSVSGSDVTAVTHPDGSFRIKVPAGSHNISASRVGFAPATRVASVAEGETYQCDFVLSRSAVLIDPIVSVGTRGGGRTATSSAVPVDVISSESIENAGLGETWEVVQRLVPSIDVTRVPIFDDQVRALSLRGLSPNHVLVLVNGKRRHTTAIVQSGPVVAGTSPVDINGIPTSAIERIEVLRDGAAAQYGSDAIAGVVNIILKSGARSEAHVSYGSTFTSEGGRDFRDGRYRSVALTQGKTSRNGASVSMTAQIRNREPTNRGYPDLRDQYFPGDARNDNPPRVTTQVGDGEAHDAAFQAVGSYPLGDAIELYTTAGASRRSGRSTAGDFRAASSDNTVRSIYPDGYLPELVSRIIDYSGVIGARGMSHGWHWDLSSSQGGNSFRESIEKTNNVSLGTASPTAFYAGTLGVTQWVSNLDFDRKVLVGPAIPLTVAAGAELRRDGYRIRSGEPDSWRDGGVRIVDGPHAGRPAPVGSQGFLGFRPSDETTPSRTDLAGYVDFEGAPFRSVVVGIAGRAEHYSDFGSTHNGRMTLRFEPVSGFAIRGAVGTGFRAPSLIQSYYSTTRAARIPGLAADDNPVIRTLPVASPEAQLLGARPLRPEESLNVSAGLVVTLPRIPTITVDFYAIGIDNKIVQSGIFSDLTIARMFADRGLRGVAGGSYFANAVDTKTLGIDIVATHGFLLPRSGTLSFTGAYNRTETKITHVASVPPELSAYQSSFFNRFDSAKIEVAQPRSNLAITSDWSAKRFSLNVHNQRFGRVSFVSQTSSALDQILAAKWITDFSASYRLARKARVAVTVANAFDVYPDEWKDFSRGKDGVLSFGGTVRYPAGQTPFGVNGRMVYLNVSLH
jgi:Outer membrane receptor for ferrienterochelin and colicins